MNMNIWISLCFDPREGASDLKVATWILWLFLHLGIKQHPNPCVCIFLGSTDGCKARRAVWERGFLVTQGKRNKGMSLGLPNSWLNFRAQFKTVLRLVCPQQKKHFLPCLPLFLHSSPNTRGQEVLRAARSRLVSSPVKKQSVYKHWLWREVQAPGQTSAQMLFMCYHSFFQLFLAAPIPLGLYTLLTHCGAICGGVVEPISARCQPTTAFTLAGILRRGCNTC